jgi:SAM-dependent methyltransferase
VDVEEPRIADAKRRNLPNAQYTEFDGRTLPFGDGSFDGAFMNEVFEHVADERRALAEIRRVLKPGGILVLISPNRCHYIVLGPRTIGPAPLIPWLPERMTRNWTVARNYWPSQLERHVREAGFAINETGFFGRCWRDIHGCPEEVSCGTKRTSANGPRPRTPEIRSINHDSRSEASAFRRRILSRRGSARYSESWPSAVRASGPTTPGGRARGVSPQGSDRKRSQSPTG